jgi:uncharacterized membrane protein
MWFLGFVGLLVAGVVVASARRRREDELAAALALLVQRVYALEREQERLRTQATPQGAPEAPAAPSESWLDRPYAPTRDPAWLGVEVLPTTLPPPPSPPAATPASTAASTPAPGPTAIPTAIPTVTPTAPPAPSPRPEPVEGRPARPAPRLPIDLEQLVGVKLYSWLAGLAVVVAAISFVRYSIDHGWVTAPVRMLIGAAVGLALVLGGESRRARAYPVTAQALAAGGIATLFATFWAAHALWELIPALVAFALLAATAAAAVVISIRRDSLGVALLGLLGGFATPWLVSSGEDRPFGLFSYLLLLYAGLSWVAHRKRWPVLAAASLALTALYQAGWVLRFLDAEKLPLALGVFLVFPLVGFAALARGARAPAGAPPLARWTAAAGALPPALLALHVAASPGLADRWALLLAFVVVVAVGLSVVAAWQGPEWLHLAGAGAALAALGGFLAASFTPAAWPGLAGAVLALCALYLGAPVLLGRLGRPFRAEGRLGVLAAPLLLLALGGAAALLDAPPVATFFLPLLAGVAACAAHAVARDDGRVHGLAVGAAVLDVAAWAAVHLDAVTLLPALAATVTLAAVALATPLLAARRPGARAAAANAPGWHEIAPYAALAGHVLVLHVAARGSLAAPAWPWLAALAALDLAFLAAALVTGRAALLGAAAGATALVLAGQHVHAPAGALVREALALGAYGVGGFLLLRRRGAPKGAPWAAAVALHGAQALLLVLAWDRSPPDAAPLATAHLALALGLLAVAWLGPAELLALTTSALVLLAPLAHPPSWASGGDRLLLSTPLYLAALVYPLLRAGRARAERLPFLGAVVASGLFFVVARGAIERLGGGGAIGLLPVAQALLLVPHLVLLVRLEPAGSRDTGRLAVVAGAALAFVTVAIPLQLEREWVTLGWALEAAALAWLWCRLPHRGLLAWSAALYGAAFVRLALNPAVLDYAPRTGTPLWNWYLYAYPLAAAALFAGARLLSSREDARPWPGAPHLAAPLAAGGGVLLFVLVNLEIADYWSEGARVAFRFSAGLAQDLTYTIAWALFALAVLAAGVVLRSRGARAAAIGLLAVTALKGFLHDLARLDGLYRVASFVGLAASLAAVALVLQRFVLRRAGPGE